MIFASVARHFQFDLAVFNLQLLELAIFGLIARNFCFESTIFAPIAYDFAASAEGPGFARRGSRPGENNLTPLPAGP